MNNLTRAIAFATLAHRGQEDKVGQPYIGHPLRVMAYVIEDNPDAYEDMLCAAVLHDVVEDCNYTVDDIQQSFGWRVAQAVDALSKRPGEKFMDYIRRCAMNPIARDVKVADIRDNSDPARKWAGTEKSLKTKYPQALAILQPWRNV